MKNNLNNILLKLNNEYKGVGIALKYSNNWELLVAVILSAQCTDKAVNNCTSKLFIKYKILSDYANANINELENDLKSIIFYKNKAKFIQNNAKTIINKFEGKLPDTMEALLGLSGVARKTANVVLGIGFGIQEGIVVDTHVLRLSQRLRMVELEKIGGKKPINITINKAEIVDFYKDADPVKIEIELMKIIPKSRYRQFSLELISHGRNICRAINPKCQDCFLNNLCPVSRA